MIVPWSAFATEVEESEEWEDIYLTDEEIDSILLESQFPAPYATGLINSWAIGISKSGSKLIIVGKTYCIPSVVKSGFKTVTIQRRSASIPWINYKVYTDIYNDNSSCVLSKSLTVPGDYQYKVTCTHYAKKNIFNTEKIDNTSNILQF